MPNKIKQVLLKIIRWFSSYRLIIISCIIVIGLGFVFSALLLQRSSRRITFLVAASNSLADTKAKADYVCDGVDDQVEIRAAIDASSIGGRVELSAGNFNVTPDDKGNAISVAKNNITIEGQGNSTVISGSGSDLKTVLLITAHKVKLTNMKVTIVAGTGTSGARPNIIKATNSTGINLDRLWVVGDLTVADDGSYNRQSGIFFDKIAYSKISNTLIENNVRIGLRLYSSDYNTIVDTISKGNKMDGILLYFNSDYNTVSDSTFIDNYYDGVSIGDDSDYNVFNNIVSEKNGGAVGIYRGNYNVVTGSRLTGSNTIPGVNYGNGIRIKGDIYGVASYNKFISNIVIDNDGDGVYIEGRNNMGNEIVDNTILNNSGDAFVDEGSSTVVRNNYGYITENSGTGIIVSGTTSVKITHGLAVIPTEVKITLTSSLGTASEIYVSNTDSDADGLKFTVAVDADPGADVTFSWRAVGEGN